MFKPRELKRKKPFLIILAVIIILALLAFFGYKIYTENKISKFDITADNISCASTPEIEGLLKSFNMNYFNFKSDVVETGLKKKFFCIGQIESEAIYPDRLKLKLTGRQGEFVVTVINPSVDVNPSIDLSLDQLNATPSTAEAYPPKVMKQILDTYKESSSSAMFIVDADGVVFQEANSDVAFPRLSIFSQNLKVGQKIPDDLIPKVAEILDRIKNMDIPTDNLLVVGEKFIIDSKPRVTFSLNRALDRQAASLQLILRQAKMKSDPDSKDSKSVESIDLRFDRPVVVYSK